VSERERIIAYCEKQAEDWEAHNLDYSKVWAKAARHIREGRHTEDVGVASLLCHECNTGFRPSLWTRRVCSGCGRFVDEVNEVLARQGQRER